MADMVEYGVGMTTTDCDRDGSIRDDYEHSECCYCHQPIYRYPNGGRWSSDEHGDMCYQSEHANRIHIAS